MHIFSSIGRSWKGQNHHMRGSHARHEHHLSGGHAMRRSVASIWGLAVIGIASALTVPVTAAQQPPPPKRGIAKAEAAGIKLDPQAKPIMAAAPAGSCLNDPTQAKCDTPKAIIADDS